jgi:hypothetical protein
MLQAHYIPLENCLEKKGGKGVETRFARNYCPVRREKMILESDDCWFLC